MEHNLVFYLPTRQSPYLAYSTAASMASRVDLSSWLVLRIIHCEDGSEAANRPGTFHGPVIPRWTTYRHINPIRGLRQCNWCKVVDIMHAHGCRYLKSKHILLNRR